MLTTNRCGWTVLEYLAIEENDIAKYENVTGAYAILKVSDRYVIGYNRWRRQWEFPADGIDSGETAREAAVRELYEETHQRNDALEFKGLFKVKDANGRIKYQAIFVCYQDYLEPFQPTETDEMDKIMLWDTKEDIGYVDECDLKIVQIVRL